MSKLHILLTSGGTRVPIDDVRYIMNMSTGRFGAQLGAHLLEDPGISLHFLHAKGSHTPAAADIRGSYTPYSYGDLDHYIGSAQSLALSKDIIISAAAVSDYTVEKHEGKITSDSAEIQITLKKSPNVLKLMRIANPAATIVGFKLLVRPSFEEVDAAVKKVFNNGADVVVYNDLERIRSGDNTRLVFRKDMSFVKCDSAEDVAKQVVLFHMQRTQSANTVTY